MKLHRSVVFLLQYIGWQICAIENWKFFRGVKVGLEKYRVDTLWEVSNPFYIICWILSDEDIYRFCCTSVLLHAPLFAIEYHGEHDFFFATVLIIYVEKDVGHAAIVVQFGA